MRIARIGFLLAVVAGTLACAATPAGAATSRARHAFKVVISPAYTTAGQPTTFQVTVVNDSSRGVALQSVQLTPPKGFALARTPLPTRFRRKASLRQRMLALRQIRVKPGSKLQLAVTAMAPRSCGQDGLRWGTRGFERGSASGPQLALQSALSRVGVTVLCPAATVCGTSGVPCTTGLSTSPSTYAVVSNASSGTLNETVNVGKPLVCPGYRFRDANWYDADVASSQPPPAGTAPLVDGVTYTIRNARAKGIDFCLGATYDFTTASRTLAPKATLPSGASGFVGLLPMCSMAKPPCISSITESQDAMVKSGVDTTLDVQIPEGQGDPWGAG